MATKSSLSSVDHGHVVNSVTRFRLAIFITASFLFSGLNPEAKGQSLVPLKDLISGIQQEQDIFFSYDESLLGHVLLPVPDPKSSLADQLKGLSKNSAFYFDTLDKDILSIIPKRNGKNYFFNVSVEDEEGQQGIPEVLLLQGDKLIAKSDLDGQINTYVYLDSSSPLELRAVGFETTTVLLEDIVTQKGNVRYTMPTGAYQLSEVVVRGYMTAGINAKVADMGVILKLNELALIPGETDGDVLQSIKSLPGISSPTGKAGNLIIRGNTAEQNLLFFDDIPLYHQGHFFGTLSPFNPSIVDNVQVHRSGYDIDLGGRVGGATEVNTSKVVSDSLQGGIVANLIFGGGHINIPIIPNKMSLHLAGRHTYPTGFGSIKQSELANLALAGSFAQVAQVDKNQTLDQTDFNLSDFNAKLNYDINSKHSIEVSSLLINNAYSIYILRNIDNSTKTDTSDLNNWGTSVKWKAHWNSRWQSTIKLVGSRFIRNSFTENRNEDSTLTLNQDFATSISDVIISTEARRYNDDNSSYWLFGYDNKNTTIDLEKGGQGPDISEMNSASSHELFTGYTLSKKKISTKIGARGILFAPTQQFRAEPRIFITYAPIDSLLLKSSYGLYSQWINTEVTTAYSTLTPQSWHITGGEYTAAISQQTMIGFMKTFSKWTFDLEGYHKRVENLFAQKTSNQLGPIEYSYGSSQTYGLDALLKRGWGNIDAWASYTLSRTMFDFQEFSIDPFLAYYDIPHQINLTGVYRKGPFSCSASWQLLSGVPDYRNGSPFTGEITNSSQPPKPINPDKPVLANGRTDMQHQLDVSVSYRHNPSNKKWRSILGLSILNVYNRDNTSELLLHQQGQLVIPLTRESIGFAPNVQLTLEW